MADYIYNPQEHSVPLEKAGDVAAICKDFFARYDLNTFIYARWYDDGSLIRLCDNTDWYDHYWHRGFIPSVPYDETLQEKQSYYALWKGLHYVDVVDDAINILNMEDPISFVKRYPGYYEAFAFAAPKTNQKTVTFYMNNIDILENFNAKFIEQASDIIELAETKQIRLPNSLRSDLRGLSKLELTRIAEQKRTFKVQERELFLTPREYACFCYLVSDKISASRFLYIYAVPIIHYFILRPSIFSF